MNTLHAGALLLAATALHGTPCGQALTIGSAAPPLDIAHWLKGEEVTTFTPGQVYVLEFWATWCAPCVANMDHLSEVEQQNATRGVHVVGVTDESLQDAVAFLCTRYGERQTPQLERCATRSQPIRRDPSGRDGALRVRAGGHAREARGVRGAEQVVARDAELALGIRAQAPEP